VVELVVPLVGGLGVILAGAALFTNAVEWVGKRLGLTHGMVGSVLAAVGTALPEAMVPVVAILLGNGDPHARQQVGIGAILGAPFMLGTLALFVTGVSAMAFFRRRASGNVLQIDRDVARRDLGFFLVAYPMALLASLLPPGAARLAVAAILVAGYVVYVWRTLRSGDTMEDHEVGPLHLLRPLARNHRGAALAVQDPPLAAALVQLALALGAIVAGAHYFVEGLVGTASLLGLSPVILSLIITPVATELPEKFNSVLWVREGKDTLALGNITGAMVFQSTIIPTLGILLTPWQLDRLTVSSAVLALLSAALVYAVARGGRPLTAGVLATGGLFYAAYVAFVTYRCFVC